MIRKMLFIKYVAILVTFHTLVRVSVELGVRVGEHRRGSKKPHKDIPFFKHIFNTDHSFDFDGARILDIESYYYRRNTSELVNIHAQTNSIEVSSSIKILLFCLYIY